MCEYNCQEISSHFKFNGKISTSRPHICGHINDTHILSFINDNGKEIKYILQRINTNIFPKVNELMSNIFNVTNHIEKKVLYNGGDTSRECLKVIPTIDNSLYYKDFNNNYFRAYNFIDGASTYMKVENPTDFYKCGKAIGNFQNLLSDFPVDKLFESIPDFHNTSKRFDDFMDAVNKDLANRADSIQDEINFIINRKNETSLLVNLLDEGKLPLRVTHNDTKFNNVMIDDITGEAICLVDLDTVMPGLSLYDYGDSIRSGATTALEDENDLSKVNFDITLFELFTKGYLESCGSSLTSMEKKHLVFSAKLITLELSMRFLMDYLNGDKYFQIHRPHHNLDRARNQLKLVKDMEKNMIHMESIVLKYI